VKYVAAYTVTWTGSIPQGFNERLELSFPDGKFQFTGLEREERRAAAEVTVPINPEGLMLRTEVAPLDGSPVQVSIAVPEGPNASEVVQTATWLLTFITDTPFRHSKRLTEDHLIAETPEDQKRLEGFGTERIWHEVHAHMSMRSFSLPQVSDDAMAKLVSRRFGLALYTEALLLERPIARFRELWRLLESAFGLTDGDLIRAMADFPPANSLGFDQKELRDLLVLRGRASHAESRMGLADHRRVTKEVQERLPRLKCLAEQLVITKKTWGMRGNGVDRVAELNAYVDSEGMLNIIRPPESD
jgi:hypothetical protein